MSKRQVGFLLFLVMGLGFANTAYAYLDPVTTSLVITAIAGLFAGAMTLVLKFWNTIKKVIKKFKSSLRGK